MTGKLITAQAFAEELVAAGLIETPAERVAKIVIVAEPRQPVRIFVEYLGEEGWLNVPRMLGGADVITGPPPPGT